MPEYISVTEFLEEVWEDYKSPTTSTVVKLLPVCRATVATLEETLDNDRSGLNKMKKAVKAIHSSGNMHCNSDTYLADILDTLGTNAHKGTEDFTISAAFKKFAVVTKELSSLMKNLMNSLNNVILFPLDAFLRGDLSGVKGDLKKPFDKAWKEYENKFTKIEKEKKQLAREAGMVKTEVTGAEVAEDMERERQVLQFQNCEYLIKVNDIKTKKGVDLLQRLVDYYQAQTNYFQDGLKTIEHFRGYVDSLVHELEGLRQKQGQERRRLVELRDSLKERMSSYKEQVVSVPSGYNLHPLQGNKAHGYEKNGFLLKKSEGKIKKVWQKRRCSVKNGILSISHSDTTKEPVKLNLLTCQVKLVPDDLGKKCFDLISSSKNRTYHFQADDSSEMEEWISVLNNAKELVLMKAFCETSTSSSEPYTQSVKELTGRIIEDIKRLPGNQHCCDCGAPGPEWLSVNLGVLICLECCGVHREMGVHVSRTQSIVIDDLNGAQLLLARCMSNAGFNDVMEAQLYDEKKPSPQSSMDTKKRYIRRKYENHAFAFVTSPQLAERRMDLKQAILSKDLCALLQVFAEGVDFMEPLPDMIRDENSLHLAIIHEDGSSLFIVDFIIQNTNSQELSRPTMDGNTALHLCATHNQMECMKLLLRTRPDLVNYENKDGLTAMDIATRLGHDTCVELMNHAVAGRCDLFGNLNINWDFMVVQDDHVDISDDELETPERKIRSRPPSLILPKDHELSYPGSGFTLPDRSHTTDKFIFPGLAAQNRPKFSSTSDSSTSINIAPPASAGLPAQRDPRKKAPPPPPPAQRGHLRNPSDPGFGHLAASTRSPNDPPPPLPQKGGRSMPGAELVLPQLPPQHSLKPKSNPRISRIDMTSKASGEDKSEPPPLPIKSNLAPVNMGPSTTNNRDRKSLYVPPTCEKPQIKPQKQRCIAVYDCVADNDDELSFRKGEVIVILSQDEEDWWTGEIEEQPQRKGMFPTTFVRLMDNSDFK